MCPLHPAPSPLHLIRLTQGNRCLAFLFPAPWCPVGWQPDNRQKTDGGTRAKHRDAGQDGSAQAGSAARWCAWITSRLASTHAMHDACGGWPPLHPGNLVQQDSGLPQGLHKGAPVQDNPAASKKTLQESDPSRQRISAARTTCQSSCTCPTNRPTSRPKGILPPLSKQTGPPSKGFAEPQQAPAEQQTTTNHLVQRHSCWIDTPGLPARPNKALLLLP